jgi:MFS family permease
MPAMTPPGGSAGRFSLLRDNEVILIVCVSTGLVMLGQGFVGPILPLFAKSFGVSAAAVGAALSTFALARLMFNIPSGIVADRWGRRILLVGGPIIAGTGDILSGTAPEFWTLLVWRFVAGIGSAMYMAGATIVITDIATNANRGRLMALNQGALLSGVSFGPVIGGLLAELAGLRAPFFAVGIVAFSAAAWNFFRVPETRGRSTVAMPSEPPAAAGWLRRMSGSLDLLLIPNFVLISLVTMSVFFARPGRQTMLPLYGDAEIGLSAGTIGLVLGLMAFINFLLTFPAGMMVDRFGAKATIVPSALLSLVGYLLCVPLRSIGGFVGASMVLSVGSGILGPAPPAYAAEVAPPERRGAAMGLYRSVGDLGFVIGPPTVGFIIDHGGFGWAFTTAGMALAGTALLFAWLAGAHASSVAAPSPASTPTGSR